MRAVLDIFRMIGIIIWTVICVSGSLIYLLLTFHSRGAVSWARWFWAPGIAFCVGARMKVIGAEHLDLSKPAIYVANHSSFLDIPLLFMAVQTPLYFVAKKELKKMPFIGWYIWAVGMIFIDRSNRERAYESLTKAGSLVRNGKSVVTFPEGTRTKDGKVGTFRKGSFHLAREAGVPVVPIYIRNSAVVWPNKAYRFTPGTVEVVIGKPIAHSELADLGLQPAANFVREKVVELGNL